MADIKEKEEKLSGITGFTSRSLVYRTLEFASPPRIPRQLRSSAWTEEKFAAAIKLIRTKYPDDLVVSPVVYPSSLRPPRPESGPNFYIDEWGCVWERPTSHYLGKVKEAPLQDLSAVTSFHPPEVLLKIDRKAIRAFCQETECFILGGVEIRLFERLQSLRGELEVFQDLSLLQPDFLSLVKLVHEFNLKMIDVWTSTPIDALVLVDDWGSQDRMLISPALWRRLFKPLYQEYIELIHHRRKKVFFHSDGFILEIIPDLIEIGIDALNAQVFTLGLEKLQKIARGRLTFWGCADYSYFFPKRGLVEIAERLRQLLAHLYTQGGLIALVDFQPGIDLQTIHHLVEAWEQLNQFL
ncbi:hypothetical protein NLC35_01240 [Candidatus Aminicenantes bacterium AC-334-K16]|jgi:hypothetical protein|nr:hypothetical protein [Candidatus Aminicenantes bacterium AC-334-K16]